MLRCSCRPSHKYGISVFVRYRDEEATAELDYNKHSGCERSVATMIYIIALQKLTAVPFRVVDEINQVSSCSKDAPLDHAIESIEITIQFDRICMQFDEPCSIQK